ncbi:MAG: Na(+)/H(+) antiporter subunit B [Wenzhouxiangella sp.]
MKNNGILRILARFLIPLILLVGLYIQFHGEYSPGGGFQAGLVFSAGWILFVLIYGLKRGLDAIPLKAMYVLSAAGVLIYALTGLAGVLLGGQFLEFTELLANPQSAQQAGIIIVEFGVGLTVATVAMLLFALFARRRRMWDEVLDEQVLDEKDDSA